MLLQLLDLALADKKNLTRRESQSSRHIRPPEFSAAVVGLAVVGLIVLAVIDRLSTAGHAQKRNRKNRQFRFAGIVRSCRRAGDGRLNVSKPRFTKSAIAPNGDRIGQLSIKG